MTDSELTRALKQIEVNRDAVDKAQRLKRHNSAAIAKSSKAASAAIHALRRSGAMKGAAHARGGKWIARSAKDGRIVEKDTRLTKRSGSR